MEHKGNWAISIPASSLGINSKSLEIDTRSLVYYNRPPQVKQWVKFKLLLYFRVTDTYLRFSFLQIIEHWLVFDDLLLHSKSLLFFKVLNDVIISINQYTSYLVHRKNSTIMAFASRVWNPSSISSQFHLQRDWKVKKWGISKRFWLLFLLLFIYKLAWEALLPSTCLLLASAISLKYPHPGGEEYSNM